MLFHVKYLLHVLILPPTSLLLLVLAGLIVGRRRPRLGRALCVAGVALLWLLSTPIAGIYLARAAEGYPALDLAQPTRAQAVVILAGGALRTAPEYGDVAAPAPITLQRLAYGAYAAKRLHLPVLVTGTPTEAAAMQDALSRQFDVEARWVDSSARDTYDNARHSAALLRPAGMSRIVLVTSAIHMRRSVHEFEAAGLSVTPAPTGLEPPPSELLDRLPLGLLPTIGGLDRSEAALREFIGDAARPLMQWLHAHLPGN